MNLIIESNFICHKLWLQAKTCKICSFEQFLKLRKKRLSATMIFLTDCSNWKFTDINEKTLTHMQEIGYLIEVISIVAHDTSKWKTQNEHNVYCYWLLLQNLDFNEGQKKEVFEKFLQEIKGIIQRKKQASTVFQQGNLSKEYIDLLQQVTGLLKEYYRFEEVEGLKEAVISPKF